MLSKFLPSKAGQLKRSFSLWKDVKITASDPILAVIEAFRKDTTPNKVSLGVGAYRDDNGQPWVLESVKKADKIIFESDYNYEYLPVEGLHSFIDNSNKLVFGASATPIKENRVATIQTLSGTGACRIAGDFFNRFLSKSVVYLPNPSWPNHNAIFSDSGLAIKEYRYYKPATKGLDYEGLVEDLSKAPEGSIILLHACSHNPTGVDPTQEQWKGIREILTKRNHIVLFDMSYQGYTTGDCETDAFAVRDFTEAGVPIIVAQSYAKNFGLYGQRIGALSFITQDQSETERVLFQLQRLIRPMYSFPPLNGARIVDTILSRPDLKSLWLQEIQIMAKRIASMRQSLVDNLKKAGSTHDWSHIVNQKGMFAYTGTSKEQAIELAEKFHVYMVHSGRISISGLNTKNVEYVAQSLHEVTKNKKL